VTIIVPALILLGILTIFCAGYPVLLRVKTYAETTSASFVWTAWEPSAPRVRVGPLFTAHVNGYLSSGVGVRAGNFLLIAGDEKTVGFVHCGLRRHFELVYREDDPTLTVSSRGVMYFLEVEGRGIKVNGGHSTIDLLARKLQERGWRVTSSAG